MMVIGMPGLTETQNRVHMALWAISGAPLIVGADLTTLDDATWATLTNPNVIAIDQDALGLQAVKVAESGAGLEVWSKPLSTPGQRAALLLNRTKSAATISFTWKNLGLTAPEASVNNAWTQESLGSFPSSFSTTVPAQDAVLILVKGTEEPPLRYEAADQAGSNGAELTRAHEITFNNVSADSAASHIEIAYTNTGPTTLFAEFRVNGQMPTRVAFPPTGSETSLGSVFVEPLLEQGRSKEPGRSKNKLSFSTRDDHGPTIAWIAVQ